MDTLYHSAIGNARTLDLTSSLRGALCGSITFLSFPAEKDSLPDQDQPNSNTDQNQKQKPFQIIIYQKTTQAFCHDWVKITIHAR